LLAFPAQLGLDPFSCLGSGLRLEELDSATAYPVLNAKGEIRLFCGLSWGTFFLISENLTGISRH
jgi:hypothetical protein